MRLPRAPGRCRHPAPRAAILAAVTLAAVWLTAAAASATPQSTARDLYLAAQARERVIRAALEASPPSPPPTRDAMRQAVAAYRQVVLQYPTSGFCDNALWLAAQMSADTFIRHGDERDRTVALQLLMSLTSEYPASPLVSRARADAARIMALPPAMAPGALQKSAATAQAAMAAPLSPEPKSPVPSPRASAAKKDEADVANATPAVLLLDVRRRTTPGGAVVEIEFDGPPQYREERLDNPSRIFFDLAKTGTMDALRDAVLPFESGPIRQVRIGRRPNSATRVVIETTDGARCTSRPATGPSRLVVACGTAATSDAESVAASAPAAPREAPAAAVASAAPAAPAEAKPEPEPPKPALVRPAPSADPPARTAPPPSTPAETSTPATPSANGRGGFSMARQLGLRVGRIVIDAGHGGRDPGAQGPGYTEADLTLDVALRLARLLAKEPGVEVVLTRNADEYVALQERTAIANREGADLFLSIHANASRNRAARGVESYLLNFASTPEAAAVAARENASSTLTMSHLNDLVKQIALNSKLDESRDLARAVQGAMVRKLQASNQQVKDLGVKQAPFVVLVGASMPSVLVEVSFVTNKQEGRLLGTGAYRQRIAEALLDGIRRYLRTLKRATTDATEGMAPAAAEVPAGLQ